VLKPFGEQAEPGAIPVDDLDEVSPGAAPEHEQVPGEWILMHILVSVPARPKRRFWGIVSTPKNSVPGRIGARLST
jgi:hypothetical protein